MSRRKDKYYHKAKNAGLRSRASFKILQLQEKFAIFTEGDVVLELGSSPGGWSQVIRELTGAPVVAVDTARMEPIPGVIFIRSNLHSDELVETITKTLSELKRSGFDVIVSDAMVKTSGDRNIDHSSSYLLCRRVMELADKLLMQGGTVMVKQFQGDLTNQFMKEWGPKYLFQKKTTTLASRAGSREIYIIFSGKKA